jgi:CheY-like chemotaxis protein
VESTTSSMRGLEMFIDNPYRYDLVITDQTMPNMTGVQLALEIKQKRPDLPVILCTGFSESINETNFKSQGIDALLMKPIERKTIAHVIRNTIEGTAFGHQGLF